MNDRKAFERRILENPQDEAPRLIYADWLEEHDEPELAAAMRRTTSEGQNALGVMSWRDWDRWCLELVPDALTGITLDWLEVLDVIDISWYACKNPHRVFWWFTIAYSHLCSGDVKALIVETKSDAKSLNHTGNYTHYTQSPKSSSKLLSAAALEWSRRKFRNPKLVGVVDPELVPVWPPQGITFGAVDLPAHFGIDTRGAAYFQQDDNATHDTETVG